MIDRRYIRAMATCAKRTYQTMAFVEWDDTAAECRVDAAGIFHRAGSHWRRTRYVYLLCHEGKSGLTIAQRRDIVRLLRDANTRR